MELKEIKSHVDARLKKHILPSHILLDRFRVIEESSRQSSAYTDPTYIPFYYYLGEVYKPQKILEMGVRLGLESGCFLKSCKSVVKFLAFQEKPAEFYSIRIAKSNIRDVYRGDFDSHVGSLHDQAFLDKLDQEKWDLAIVNEEESLDRHLECLDLLWQQIAPEGLIVMDYIDRHPHSGQAFHGFCKSRNRVPITFQTRYGVGVVQK
jgi:predicted O-methyltransferase YrrM